MVFAAADGIFSRHLARYMPTPGKEESETCWGEAWVIGKDVPRLSRPYLLNHLERTHCQFPIVRL
ncbi:MAG: hypothetical protein IPM39_23170 [Chloroflexi bacterium]|nr:hypothetical protein [Chloroflexota bacterium]